MSDPRHKTLYLSADVLEEAEREAARLERTLCEVFRLAWRIARDEIRQLPSVSGERIIGRHNAKNRTLEELTYELTEWRKLQRSERLDRRRAPAVRI